MQTIYETEFQTCFPDIFKEITQGKSVRIIYSVTNQPVATITPYTSKPSEQKKIQEDLIAERRKKIMENHEKYSISFKSIGYKFDREEANNYEED